MPEALARWHALPHQDVWADLTCMIKYETYEGVSSERRIRIKSLRRKAGYIYILAWCFERQAGRTFRLDRVVDCWDCLTGEVIDLHLYLSASSRRQHSSEADTSADLAGMLKRCGAGVRALRFLAAADGHIDPREEEVIIRYAQTACEKPPSVAFNRSAIFRHTRLVRPDGESLLQIVASVERQGRTAMRALLAAALELMAADGHEDPAERRLVGQLRAVLAYMPGR